MFTEPGAKTAAEAPVAPQEPVPLSPAGAVGSGGLRILPSAWHTLLFPSIGKAHVKSHYSLVEAPEGFSSN